MPSSKNNPAWGFVVRNRMRFTWWLLAALLLLALILGKRPLGLLTGDARALVAAGLLLAGLGLRSWAAGVIRKDGELATNGPYALSRHPLYVGSSLFIIGLALLWGGFAYALVGAALAALIYLPTLSNEERVLADYFPADYPAYKQKTGRFGPKALPDLRARWRLQQWLANNEYELPGIAAVLIILLEIWAHT